MCNRHASSSSSRTGTFARPDGRTDGGGYETRKEDGTERIVFFQPSSKQHPLVTHFAASLPATLQSLRISQWYLLPRISTSDFIARHRVSAPYLLTATNYGTTYCRRQTLFLLNISVAYPFALLVVGYAHPRFIAPLSWTTAGGATGKLCTHLITRRVLRFRKRP